MDLIQVESAGLKGGLNCLQIFVIFPGNLASLQNGIICDVVKYENIQLHQMIK